jgi:hypothetical protein
MAIIAANPNPSLLPIVKRMIMFLSSKSEYGSFCESNRRQLGCQSCPVGGPAVEIADENQRDYATTDESQHESCLDVCVFCPSL